MEKNKQYELVFNHFLMNKDGKISALELQQCVGAIGKCEITVEDAATAMECFDGDGDGSLGFNDFVKFVDGDGVIGKDKDYLKEAFKYYENERSECITSNSFKKMLSRLGISKTIDDCVAIIHHFDLNGDGVLNFDEFKVMMM